MKGGEEKYSLNYMIYNSENILTNATSRRRSEVGTMTNCPSGDDDSIAVGVFKKSIKIDQGLQTAHSLPMFVKNQVKVILAVTDVKH